MPAKRKDSANPSTSTTSNPTDSPTPAPVAPSASTHIVSSIFPAREIHLFGGASHSGKTTLVLHQFIARWRRGLPVFGHESFPAPFCFVVCDRPLSMLEATLTRTSLASSSDFPALSLVDSGVSVPTGASLFDQALSMARRAVPDLRVLFLDGIHRICTGKANDLKEVSEFLVQLSRRCQDENLTIIGIGHAAKVKGDEKLSNPRERFLGSSAWGTSTGTMTIVERAQGDDIRDPRRNVLIMPLNAPDQILHYALDSKGLFIPADIDDPSRYDDFAMLISINPDGTELTKADFMDMAEAMGSEAPSGTTVDRYVKRLIDEGVLEKAKWGHYRIPVKQ